jgi:DNA polymerase-3 subunit epsilon
MRLALRVPGPRLKPDHAARVYARAQLARGRTSWREATWCALDFELTGLDPAEDEIISFGAIPIENARLQLQSAVSGLVKPSRKIGVSSIPVHGLRDADLASAPSLADGIGPLVEAIAGRVLVFHAARIDRPFLKRALREKGVRLRRPFVDTEVLGRLWLHERDGGLRRGLSLTDLASALELPADRPHDALGDALTTAQVFIALAAHLETLRPETVGSLVRAARRVDALTMLREPSRP